MGGEMQKTQEVEEQDLRNSARVEKSIAVNDDDTEKEVARKMAVDKPDLKRRRDMWEQSHVEDSSSSVSGLPDSTPTPGGIDDATKKLPRVADSDVNPAAGVTPDPVPVGMGTTTPPVGGVEPIPDAINTLANLWLKVDEERKRPLTDEEFDAMFHLLSKGDVPKDGLPFLEPKDYEFFGPLLNKEDEEALSPDQQEGRKIKKLLLELKNGTPQQMKTALRQLIDYAREFGATPLLDQILPLLWSRTLNSQETRLMVKVFCRVIYELDDLVRPYVVRIVIANELMLMDEDENVRAGGTEIIYNLSKAAGLNPMIDAFRSGIVNTDERVREATARCVAVVASALGIAAVLPFVKEVCQMRRCWLGRQTGFMSVHHIIVSIGSAVLPHSRSLLEIIKLGLNDEFKKVRTVPPLALGALNKFAAQYGINI